jgi:hypothetical protein
MKTLTSQGMYLASLAQTNRQRNRHHQQVFMLCNHITSIVKGLRDLATHLNINNLNLDDFAPTESDDLSVLDSIGAKLVNTVRRKQSLSYLVSQYKCLRLQWKFLKVVIPVLPIGEAV